MSYFVGIDVGTSGTKAVLFSENGDIAGTSYREYELIQPHNGWAQQHPLDWKNAALDTLKELAKTVDSSEIKGVGISGQMHGLVLLDSNDEPLMDSIIWCDQRTTNEVNQICEVIGKEKYIELTFNAPNTSFTLSKLLWVKNNEPEIYSKINKALLPKDYINFCLTGKYVTDVSDASGTGYFSVKNRSWCDEILSAFDIDKTILPEVRESSEVAGYITQSVAEYTGLSTSTVVAAGAGDQAAAALGNSILNSGDISVSLGTSGVVFSAVDSPVYDTQGRIHTFCHSVPGMWHVMGVTQGCGLSVNWFKHNFAPTYSYKELDNLAKDVESDGVIYLPYLMGERTPHLDPNCRGAFVGLSAGHSTANIFRAVIEGVCFSLKDCDDLLKEIGVKSTTTSVCGGGANSNLWLQILSDVIGRDVITSDNSESGARGVAMLAAVASEHYPNLATANEHICSKGGNTVNPNNSNYNYYENTHKKYKALYLALKQALDA